MDRSASHQLLRESTSDALLFRSFPGRFDGDNSKAIDFAEFARVFGSLAAAAPVAVAAFESTGSVLPPAAAASVAAPSAAEPTAASTEALQAALLSEALNAGQPAPATASKRKVSLPPPKEEYSTRR